MHYVDAGQNLNSSPAADRHSVADAEGMRSIGAASCARWASWPPKDLTLLPDVQTVAETVPGYEASTWAEIGVPRGTPPEIIERLNREVNAGLAQPDIRARLADVGTVPMVLSAAAFKAYIAAEAAKWDKVVKIAGIKPQ